MSISLADTLPTTLPTMPAPPASASDASMTLLWIGIGWAAAGLLAAYLMGVFRRKSIVGPERLAPSESAWDLLIVFFIVYFGGMVVGSVIYGLKLHLTEPQLALLSAAIDLLSFVAIVLLLQRIRSGSVRLLGLDPSRFTGGIVAGAATMFVLYPLIQLTGTGVDQIYDHFHFSKPKPHQLLQLIGSTKDQRLAVFAVILACVIAPLAEELMFRGLLQTLFVRLYSWMAGYINPTISAGQMSTQSTIPSEYESALMPIASSSAPIRWAAVATSAALFAAVHGEPAFLAPLFVLALGLGYVYERTGNLWVTITAHALFNTAQILLYMEVGR